MRKIILGCLILIVLTAAGCSKQQSSEPIESEISELTENVPTPVATSNPLQTVDFSKLNATYAFTAEIPQTWQTEYIAANQSINIYDSNKSGATNLDKSVIFIRNFSANSFQTLSTVDIINKENSTILGRNAVRYEIKKKPAVPNFPNQPLWRNGQHKLIDIRLSDANPSVFFVIAYNPTLPTEQFEAFVQSLQFQKETSEVVSPLTNAASRITKKPFGILVSPTSSPVQPERFSGYHNAVDFEIFSGEESETVMVRAICSGPLISKRVASGYGGLAMQSCTIKGSSVTVLYGHVKISSIRQSVNDAINAGDSFTELGAGGSAETGGERKHLHLGIHKGSSTDIRGYVSKQSELSNWVDFTTLVTL